MSLHPIRNALPVVALVIACLFVYWPGLQGGFIFDDFPNLVLDDDWKVRSGTWNEWVRAMSSGIASDSGRPLALLTFAANHYFWGMSPWSLKATGLAFHTLNTLLVYLLCRQLMQASTQGSTDARPSIYAAFLISTAWALHPLQVSTVLYVIQRMEIGAHAGILIALTCYLHARKRQQDGRIAWPWFTGAAFATALGLGFKETAALVPAYTLAIELCILHFRTGREKASSTLIALYAVATAIATTAFFLVVLPDYLPESVYAFRGFTLQQRLLTQLPVLTHYLGQILLPLPQHLLFYYDTFPISKGLLAPPGTLYSLLILSILAASAIAAARKIPLYALGIAWFFASHVLTSNVIPLELAFEHRNYFSILGILIAISGLLRHFIQRRMTSEARMIAAALPVLALALLCWIQANTWADPFRLATSLASRNPESPRATYDMGQMMLIAAGGDPQSPLLSLARREFEHASSLPGSSPLPEQGLIILLSRNGQQVPEKVWIRLREKLELKRAGAQETTALFSINRCRISDECRLDDQQLFQTFMSAFKANPRDAVITTMYADFAFSVLDDDELAIRMAREALDLQPGSLQYRANLAKFLAATPQHCRELKDVLSELSARDAIGAHTGLISELSGGSPSCGDSTSINRTPRSNPTHPPISQRASQ